MNSFVNIKYSAQHHGANQAAAVAATPAASLPQGSSGPRTLSTLLLSAVVTATMVVAYEVMDSVAEGHLLVMWMVLWGVAFAVLALFAGASRQLAARLKSSLDAWSRKVAEGRSDQRLWAAAQQDPRIMSDLQAALARQDTGMSADNQVWGDHLVKLNTAQLRKQATSAA